MKPTPLLLGPAARVLPALLLMLAVPHTHAAGPFTVTTTGDTHAANPGSSPNDSTGHVSLRSAVEAANSQAGATTINVPAGIYNLTLGEIDLAPIGHQTNTLAGAGAAITIVNQTDPTNRIFNVDVFSVGGTVTTFSGLTLQGGHDGVDYLGGAGILAGSLTATPADGLSLNNCVFQNNHCTTGGTREPGGGVQMAGGNLNLSGCTFSNNSSGQSFGGAIFMLAQTVVSALNATNCIFSGNSLTNNSGAGPDGGGALLIETPPGSVHNLVGCTFTNNLTLGNSGDTYGGAVQLNGGTLNISGSTFVNNTASGQGGLGGALYGDSGTVNVYFSRLAGNTASSGGGALFNHGSNDDRASATNDWWGCNYGPGGDGCDVAASDTEGTLIFNPWLVLSNSASPGAINVGQSTTFTASVLQNSAGQTLTAAQVAVLTGLPLTWNGAFDGGISSAQTVLQANGMATATFTNNNTCGSAGANVVLDNAVAAATVLVQCPDLTLAKTDNVNGLVALGGNWTWTLHVANAGPAPASFSAGNTIALDNLPIGVAYGPPAIDNASGVSGTLVPGLDVNTNLTVTAAGPVTLAPGGSFDLQISATPLVVGYCGNPRYGGVCVVNPNNNVPESNPDNNYASDAVVVECPVITATVSGDTNVCPGAGAVVTVSVSGGTPPYNVTLNNGGGTLSGSGPFLFSVNPATNTTYQVGSGADAQGCPVSTSGSATVTVVSDSNPPAITVSPAGVLANSAGNQASAPAGYAGYAWTISNGAITGPANQPIVTYVAGPSNNVVLGLTVSNGTGCSAGNSAGVPVITGFSVHTNVTFTDALASTSISMAFDGTNYWSCSGGGTAGVRLAAYGLSGTVSNTYSPGLDFRSLTTAPDGTLLARAYGSGEIYVMSSPGVFVSSGVTLTGGTLDPQASVVLNGAGTEFDALSGGVISRWNANGAYLGTVQLIGFGSLTGESSSPQERGLATLGNLWLTYNGAGVLSLWDNSGNRITELALPGAGTSFDSDYGFSYCNGKVFIVDVAGGTWRGFDLFGGASVAVLAAEEDTLWMSDVTNKIDGVGSLPNVNLIPVTSPAPIPTLTQLRAYQSVLVFSDYGFTDPVAMGNVLADYVDQGGGVVMQTFAFATGDGYGIQGRISTNGYLPFTLAGVEYPTSLTMVEELPQSPLLAGVTSLNGGTTSFQNGPLSLTTGATLVADWSNDQPLVGILDDHPGRCAGLNFFPPSSDAFSSSWVSGTGGAQLMANALLWSGRIPPTLISAPGDQVLPPGVTANFAVTAAGTPPLSYQWRLNGTNLPSATNPTLAVTMGAGTEGAYSVVVSNLYGATTSLNAQLNPPLRFLPPVLSGGAFTLFLVAADGSPVAANRAARVNLYAATNLTLPFARWQLLTNAVVSSGNLLRADGFTVTNSSNLFIRAAEAP